MHNTILTEVPFSITLSQICSMVICIMAIILATNYIRKLPGANKGFLEILCGFSSIIPFILFSPLFGYILKEDLNNSFSFIFLISLINISVSASSAFFIAGGLKILGKIINNPSILALFIVLLTLGFLLEFGAKNQVYYPGSFIAAFGHFILAFCMIQTRSYFKTSGFKLSGWSLAGMSLYYILIYFSYGAVLTYVWFILPSFCMAILLGMMLISNNLIWQRGNEFEIDAAESRKRLKLIIQSSPFPIIICHLKDDSLMLVNKKAAQMFNISLSAPGKYKASEYFADPASRKLLFSKLENTPVVEDFEILAKKADSTDTFWISVSARVIDFDYELALYMAFQDITNRKEKEIILYDQATRDPLTGIYNRRQLEELMLNELNRANRYGLTFTVLMIDADHFKNVNDTYGHQAGDLVLKMITNTCSELLRESDIIGRFGGEEFIIVLPETGMENALIVADRIREKIANNSVFYEDENGHTSEICITVSIGIAESNDITDIELLIKDVDEALYEAKENGRNRIEKAPRRGITPLQGAGRSIPENLAADDGISEEIEEMVPSVNYDNEELIEDDLLENSLSEAIDNFNEADDRIEEEIIVNNYDDGIPLDDSIDAEDINNTSVNNKFFNFDPEAELENEIDLQGASSYDPDSTVWVKPYEDKESEMK